jgi:hypothetical protein
MGRDLFSLNDGKDISEYFSIDRKVDYCPLCNTSIKPIGIFAYNLGTTKSGLHEKIEVIYRCPVTECRELFIAYYTKSPIDVYQNTYHFIGCAPFNFKGKELDEHINNLSSKFVEIFNQAKRAEELRLSHICGMGYRKSLEFLIKDYLISKYPEKEENIKKMYLSNCINDFVDNDKVKFCAERAAWLGNDETHYIRLWEDKDINDLKILIQLTINYITDEITLELFKEGMKEKRK